MNEEFDLIIEVSVNERGELGTLFCFEHKGKKFCVYYPEPWEDMEEEMREKGFPDNIIKFIHDFLVKYEWFDWFEDEEEELEEDWIL